MRNLLTFLFILGVLQGQAQTYDYNTRCVDALEKVLQLRFEEAQDLVNKEKKENPKNLLPYYIENTIDFLTIYINEEEDEFKRLAGLKDVRMDKIRSGDESSPYYRLLQAELHIQWAFSRLKFEEYLAAFSEIKKAYGLLKDNQDKHPNFLPNLKSLGMLHALFGAIPDQYKWGANMLGMSGDIDEGLNEIARFIRSDGEYPDVLIQEATLYYAFLSLYLQKDYDKAWNIVRNLDTRNNMLYAFCKASVALRTGRCDEAITALSNRPSGSNYFNFPYLDFMMGLAKTRRLDTDANRYFERFLVNFKGKNYIKEAYQKMAWNALISGDKTRYTFYMRRVELYGADIIEDDKQALLEATSGVVPDLTLLRSRLLFDGGYYKRALQELEGKSTGSFKREKDKVEFTYRAGRIYHESGNTEKAKSFYATTISNGSHLEYYYAASAALQLGLIFEKESNTEKAKYYYNRCLDMKNKEYKTSLDSQAKAGLNRLDS